MTADTDHARALEVLGKITPGPWQAWRNSSFWQFDAPDDGQLGDVCATSPGDPDSGKQETNARAIAAVPAFVALYAAALAYRQAEMDYVFMAERPDEEYVAADVHLARMHMHRAATALDAALAAVPKAVLP